jgi:hypothetical protein
MSNQSEGKPVDKEALDDFLGNSKQDSQAPDGRERIHLDGEAQRSLQNEKPPEDVADEGTRVPTMDPTMIPGQNTQTEHMKWSMRVPRIGEIEVTGEEKKLYLKSLLNDTPLELDIEMPGAGIFIKLQTKTAEALDIIFMALAKDIEDKLIMDPSSQMTRLQQYSLCIMLLKVDQSPFETFTYERTTEDIYKVVDRLRKHRVKLFGAMQASRINMLTYAASVFEAKVAACDQNVHNKDFYDPAD